MKPPAWLRNRYEASRSSSLPARARAFPPAIQRYFSNVAGYEPAEFVRMLVGDPPGTVLVVGAGGGRDSFWLEASGHRVVSCDLVRQHHPRPLVLGDMARLPVRSRSFDVVVISDALEHTFDDRDALLEAHRVLRAGGRLVLNVPLGDDVGEEHVRVYSERTIRRTLRSCGFDIDDARYRGIFPLIELYVPGARALFHAVNLVAYVVRGRSYYHRALAFMTDVDWAHSRPGRVRLRRLAHGHGVYIAATATSGAVDYQLVNRQSYTDQIDSIAPVGHCQPG